MLTALLTTRHLYARTYLLAPLPLYSQARFLESPSRAWNECGLASHALVAAASPLFALGVAFKCEARVEPDCPLLRRPRVHVHAWCLYTLLAEPFQHTRTCTCTCACASGHGSRAPAYRCGRSYVKRAISRRFVFGGLNKEAMIGTGKTTPNRLWWRCFPAYIALLDRL